MITSTENVGVLKITDKPTVYLWRFLGPPTWDIKAVDAFVAFPDVRFGNICSSNAVNGSAFADLSNMPLIPLHGGPSSVVTAMTLVIFLIFAREIPSFFILEIRLVLGNPSRAAAPSGPPIIQPVSSNVRKIRYRA